MGSTENAEKIEPLVNGINVTENTEEAEEPKKLSYFSAPSPWSFLPLTFGELIDKGAKEFGNASALIIPFQGINKSFKEIKTEVDDLASGLYNKLGLRRGDHLGIWSLNSWESHLLRLAGWKLGLVSVLLNPAVKSKYLVHALKLGEVDAIFIPDKDEARNVDFYEILKTSIPDLIVGNEGNSSKELPKLKKLISISNYSGSVTINQLKEAGQLTETDSVSRKWQMEAKKINFDDVAIIFFTSGTTGLPKAVSCSHHAFINSAFLAGQRMEMSQKDVLCLGVQSFHGFGLQFAFSFPFLFGCPVVFPSYGHSPEKIAESSLKFKCSVIIGTPTIFSDIFSICKKNEQTLDSTRLIVTSGSMFTSGLYKDFKRLTNPTAKIINAFGMTELGFVFISGLDDAPLLALKSVGRVLDHVEVKVIDPSDESIVPVGSVGELCVRSFSGSNYWGTNQENLRKDNGWIHTGDLFALTPSGHGKVEGRLKEIINRGGEKFHHKEIEDVLNGLEEIAEAFAFCVPDPRLGEEVGVWVKLHPEKMLTKDQLLDHCRKHLAHFKVPKYINFVPAFPRNLMGKVQKFKMTEATLAQIAESRKIEDVTNENCGSTNL